MHLRNYGMKDHIPKLSSRKRLHPYCHASAKGQMSHSVTCTFLRAIYQMWWRQNLFQEPSINGYCPLWNILLWSFVSQFPWPRMSFLPSHCSPYLYWQDLTNLQDPGQMPLLPWSNSWILNWIIRFLPLCSPDEFLLHLHLNYNCLCASCFLHHILSSLRPKNMPHHCATAPNIVLCN